MKKIVEHVEPHIEVCVHCITFYFYPGSVTVTFLYTLLSFFAFLKYCFLFVIPSNQYKSRTRCQTENFLP